VIGDHLLGEALRRRVIGFLLGELARLDLEQVALRRFLDEIRGRGMPSAEFTPVFSPTDYA